MKSTMRWMCAIILLCMATVAQASSPNKIVGLNADATGSPPPLPLTVVALCVSTCPLNTAPDLVVTTRFWGISAGVNCRVSNDGGATWGACTTTPLAGNLTTRRHIAGAADGSVVVVANSGGDCVVRRSTNAATSWSTVFTVPGNDCTGGVTGRTLLKCKLNGVCVFVSYNNNTLFPMSLTSTDNGLNWTFTEITTVRGSGSFGQFAFDGVLGAQYTGSNSRAYLIDGGVNFSQTVAWPPLGFTVSCDGSYILGSNRFAMCLDSSVDQFQQYTTVGAFVRSLLPPLARMSSIDSDQPIVEGFSSTVMYVAATQVTDGSGTGIGIWVSTDAGVSFIRLFTSTRPNDVTLLTAGDVNQANGCVYISAGGPVNFFKICK